MTASRVDVTEVIDAAPLVGLPSQVALLGFLIMIIDGFDLQSIAFAAPAVARDWHIRPQLLGPVLAASIVGMAIGSVALGWLGDRIGRKRAFCSCFVLLSIGSLACAYAGDIRALVLFRLLTGVGLGGAAPLAAALIAEWTPKAWRTLGVTLAIVGVPLGGMVGAAVAERIIPAYGWRSVFFVGTGASLLFLLVALTWVPESPKYLAARPSERTRLAKSLNRLVHEARYSAQDEFVVSEQLRVARSASIASLLRAPYVGTTILLWTAFSCNTLVLYSFVNWLPTVLSSAGVPLQAALRGSLWFNSGGILGALFGSALISLYGSRTVGTCVGVAGAVAALLIGLETSTGVRGAEASVPLFALIVVAGASLNGMQTFLYSVAAHSYPTDVRSTGVGCSSAVARVGGVLSSALGSLFFILGIAVAQFFYILGAAIAAVALSFFALRRHIPGARRRADRLGSGG